MPRATRQQTQGQTAVTFCDHCGNSIEDSTLIQADGRRFCSAECAEAEGFVKCAHCGTYHLAERNIGVFVREEWYCSDTCVHEAGYTKCEQCGEWLYFLSHDHVAVQDESNNYEMHRYCSTQCASAAGAYACEHCGGMYFGLRRHTDTGMLCAACANDEYYFCETCGHYVLPEDWNGEDERCYSCSEEEDGSPILHRYGYRPPTRFFGDTRQAEVPYLGVELETDINESRTDESYRSRKSYCHALRSFDEKDRFWLTEDGSLACGVEVTSQPMTLDEHINSGLWEDVREAALEHGFTSHNNGNCGLHIHINRDYFGKGTKRQHAGGYNLAMLVSRFERQMTQFSRRTNNRWCEYGIHAEFMDKDNEATQSMNMFDKSQRMCESRSYEHSQCVNFQHSATFELRIFRGTLRLATLYASLAMAQGLARAAKHHSQVWCETVDWYSLMDDITTNTQNETARTAFTEYLAERGVA